MKDKRVIYITQTAVMLALLIGTQYFTRSFGQFVTGSLVNFILLASTFLIGIRGGLAVAVLSPFLAFLAGIGPAFIQITPLMAAGNTVLVIIAQLVRKNMAGKSIKDVVSAAAGLIAAGAAKTGFLWLGITVIVLPLIPGLNERQIAVISAAFSWPQLVTALIGGALAMLIVPVLKKAITKSE